VEWAHFMSRNWNFPGQNWYQQRLEISALYEGKGLVYIISLSSLEIIIWKLQLNESSYQYQAW